MDQNNMLHLRMLIGLFSPHVLCVMIFNLGHLDWTLVSNFEACIYPTFICVVVAWMFCVVHFSLIQLERIIPYLQSYTLCEGSFLALWFRVFNHRSKACMVGLGPTNFVIRSCSFKSAIRVSNFWESTSKVSESFLTRKPLKFLSTSRGRTSLILALNGLVSSPSSWSLAFTITSIAAYVILVSCWGISLAIHSPFSSIIGLNQRTLRNLTFAANDFNSAIPSNLGFTCFSNSIYASAPHLWSFQRYPS